MVVSLKRHRAAEKKAVDACVAQFPGVLNEAERDLRKITQYVAFGPRTRILEIGAAQGMYVRACRRLGYDAEGIEPDVDAISSSAQLDDVLQERAVLTRGVAESMPYASGIFDLVLASSVLEHVADVEKVFAEVCRVLKPGGAFFFSSASSVCPMQQEIRFFPFFGWYPDSLKKRVMHWAKENAPGLVGFTEAPAINWFSPGKTSEMAARHGFSAVYDQWDLKYAPDLKPFKRTLLSFICSSFLVRSLANVFVPGCFYLLVKKCDDGANL